MSPTPVRRAMRPLCHVLIAVAALGGCADDHDAVLEPYLNCDECGPELAGVVAEGNEVLRPLATALYFGPSVSHQLNHLDQVRERLRAGRASRQQLPRVQASPDTTTALRQDWMRLRRTHQQRAAIALRVIDTPESRAVLHTARLEGDLGLLPWDAETLTLVRGLDHGTPITAVVVSAPTRTVPVGGTVTVTARVDGPLPLPQGVLWASATPAVMTVTAAGEATRVGPGPALVRACAVTRPLSCGSIRF